MIGKFIRSPTVTGIVGIFGFIFGIYTAFFYEKKPEIAISIESVSKVFDLYRPVGGLEVFFGDENLRSSKKNLWVVTATVKNVGNSALVKGDFDESVPLGIETVGAVIAERPSVKSSDEYIEKNLTVTHNDSKLTFSPIIIEAGESFEITAVLLGSDDVRPAIKPIGKIAGVKKIILTTPDAPTPTKSIYQQVIAAESILIHAIRAVLYIFCSFIIIGILGALTGAVSAPIVSMIDKRNENTRRKELKEYKKFDEINKQTRYIMEQYVLHGRSALTDLSKYIINHKNRVEIIHELAGKISSERAKNIFKSSLALKSFEKEVEENLRDAKLAQGEGIIVELADGLESSLFDLCSFLKIEIEPLPKMPLPIIQDRRGTNMND